MEVFLKQANPLNLLKNSLTPSRGVNTDNFTLFNSELGIFDLAGQENKNWFSTDTEIFENSDIILCVFDINNSLEEIISFLVRLLKIKKKTSTLSNCNIMTFLHKIDLVSSSYIAHKVKALKTFFKEHYPLGLDIKVFATSIAKEFFYRTYMIIVDCLNLIIKEGLIPISDKQFNLLKKDLFIILETQSSKRYDINNLSKRLKLNKKYLYFHLKRLERLGFLEFIAESGELFQFTKRCEFFKEGFQKEINKVEKIKKEEKFPLFKTFQQLYNVPMRI